MLSHEKEYILGSRWRSCIGQDKLELLLGETLAAATRAKAVDPARFERVTIDTTAQTKAVRLVWRREPGGLPRPCP